MGQLWSTIGFVSPKLFRDYAPEKRYSDNGLEKIMKS